MASMQMERLLNGLRRQLELRGQARRERRLAKGKAEQGGQAHVHIPGTSGDVRGFLDEVMAAVLRDQKRLMPPPPPPVAPLEQTAKPAEMPDLTNLAFAGAPAAHVAQPKVQMGTVHLRPLIEAWQKVDNILPHVGSDNLPAHLRACHQFMTHELTQMTEGQPNQGATPAVLLNKIKQAVQAFGAGRTMDTVTILKNALTNDPHNHTLLVLLSQVLYQLASNGQQTMLPEAHEYGQRSIIFSEKMNLQKLTMYRYLAIVTEREFSAERALEWLRETGFLQAKNLTGLDGIMAQRGIYLRAWAILATISPHLWGESEFLALKELVMHVMGGAMIYVGWFRAPLLQAAAVSKTPLPEIEEIERVVRGAYSNYEETIGGLRQLPLKTSGSPWFLRVRFLNTVVMVAPLPAFDHVLAMIALDGSSWREDVYPDRELRSQLEDRSMSYWRLWAMVTTPFKNVQQPYLLPAEETVEDGETLATFDKILETLRQEEMQRITKPKLWEELKPWMVRWYLDHLLAISTGSNKPRTRFAPNLIPYTHFYRHWQDPLPTGLLPSEIIAEHARRGAFASMYEVHAALEGASRLLDDPVHGILSNQKRALAHAKKQFPKKYNGNELGGVSGSGVMLALGPLALMGMMVAVFNLSANMGQAIGLMLVIGGVGGVLGLNLVKSEN